MFQLQPVLSQSLKLITFLIVSAFFVTPSFSGGFAGGGGNASVQTPSYGIYAVETLAKFGAQRYLTYMLNNDSRPFYYNEKDKAISDRIYENLPHIVSNLTVIIPLKDEKGFMCINNNEEKVQASAFEMYRNGEKVTLKENEICYDSKSFHSELQNVHQMAEEIICLVGHEAVHKALNFLPNEEQENWAIKFQKDCLRKLTTAGKDLEPVRNKRAWTPHYFNDRYLNYTEDFLDTLRFIFYITIESIESEKPIPYAKFCMGLGIITKEADKLFNLLVPTKGNTVALLKNDRAAQNLYSQLEANLNYCGLDLANRYSTSKEFKPIANNLGDLKKALELSNQLLMEVYQELPERVSFGSPNLDLIYDRNTPALELVEILKDQHPAYEKLIDGEIIETRIVFRIFRRMNLTPSDRTLILKTYLNKYKDPVWIEYIYNEFNKLVRNNIIKFYFEDSGNLENRIKDLYDQRR